MKEKLEAQGYEVTGETGPQLLPDIKTQLARWARIVKAAGFSSEDRGSTKIVLCLILDLDVRGLGDAAPLLQILHG